MSNKQYKTGEVKIWAGEQQPACQNVIRIEDIALTSDTTGVNTGDETTSTIKTKLDITTLSGSNTGDETKTTIQSKLFASIVNAVNDAAAATAGVAVNGIYRNGSILMIRVV